MSGPQIQVRPRRELSRQRRRRGHPCWDHLIAAPLWPLHGVNLGTLLRTCDAVGACLAVPRLPWVPEALGLLDVAVEIPMVGTGASLNVAVAGSLVLYRLAGFL
ncbi:MAG TPA: hypothetical protein VGH27_31155 [Streptosporangiaceae bacterium]